MKVILFLFFTTSFLHAADDDVWDRVQGSEYDFKFAYYEDIEVQEDKNVSKTADEKLEIQKMKQRAMELQKKIENKDLAKQNQSDEEIAENLKKTHKNDFEDLVDEDLLAQDIEQNIPLKDKSFEIKKDDNRKFSYDPIVQYKSKVEKTNFTNKKKNYFLPWEQKYKTLVPLGVMASLIYNFGSISENVNQTSFETDKKARVGFNLNWTFEKEFINELFFVFSTQFSFITAPSLAGNTNIGADWQLFERIYFPTLRFSYFTPFAEGGINRVSHLSPSVLSSTVQVIDSRGFFLGLGSSFRVPVRNTEVSLSAGLRTHFLYESESDIFGKANEKLSGIGLFANMNWHFLKKIFFETQISKTSLSATGYEVDVSRYYAGFGLRI